MRALQVLLVAAVTFAVWSIGFAPNDEPPQVLPDTETAFSLDLEVVGSADHPVVYVVEQRARPAYRIFALDPATGVDETVFTVPDNAIIYGIALSNDGTTLAINYSPDFNLDGSGLWTLDLDDVLPVEVADLTEVVPVTTGVYLTDPEWAVDDATVFTTVVDRRGADEQLDIASIALDGATYEVIVTSAIDPTIVGDRLFFLDVDDVGARRSIGAIDAGGVRTSIQVGDGSLDLDDLTAGPEGRTLLVSAIETDDSTIITIGQTAGAHGNHDVPSAVWQIDVTGGGSASIGAPATITYDASFTGELLLSATREGLSFTAIDTARVNEIIESRAVRFVAG